MSNRSVNKWIWFQSIYLVSVIGSLLSFTQFIQFLFILLALTDNLMMTHGRLFRGGFLLGGGEVKGGVKLCTASRTAYRMSCWCRIPWSQVQDATMMLALLYKKSNRPRKQESNLKVHSFTGTPEIELIYSKMTDMHTTLDYVLRS